MERNVTYHKEPELPIVPCSSIRDRIYVVEEHSGVHESIDKNDSSLVVLVKKRSLWATYFTDLLPK
jgi:hypothetical protein